MEPRSAFAAAAKHYSMDWKTYIILHSLCVLPVSFVYNTKDKQFKIFANVTEGRTKDK